FFYFSSRRRHTRFSRDWSSDVCSSDLTAITSHNQNDQNLAERNWSLSHTFFYRHWSFWRRTPYHNTYMSNHALPASHCSANIFRSEERRVGKECRSRWSAGS